MPGQDGASSARQGYRIRGRFIRRRDPQELDSSVERGIRESAERGYLAGFPVTDFRATLYDGKYHDVDSSDMAFRIAGSLAFKEAMKQAAQRCSNR